MSKSVWYNDIQRDAFIEKNCARCFQPDEARKRVTGTGPGCPHLARAEQDKMPKPWTRRRGAAWGDTYRCDDHLDKPPVNRRKTAKVEIEPMLDVEPVDRHLVPVDGWPDWASLDKIKKNKGDHA